MDSPRVLSLFSGIGGLDLAVQLVCPGARAVGYAERDAYAAAVLLARMEDQAMEPAPVFIGDIRDLDGRGISATWITGGFPCQDISVAGRGAGLAGRRPGLWWEMLRIIGEVRPQYAFLENVSAITARGGLEVIGSLAEIGYDAEWLTLRASDVGAPHQRNRWFCLACDVPNSKRSDIREQPRRRSRQSGTNQAKHGDLGESVFPPGPADDWSGIPRHLRPAAEPGFRVLVDGTALVVDESRTNQLRCCGNAVVPLQAAAALKELLRRVGDQASQGID